MAILLRAGTVRHWNLPNHFLCGGCGKEFKNRYPTHVLMFTNPKVKDEFGHPINSKVYYHSLNCTKTPNAQLAIKHNV